MSWISVKEARAKVSDGVSLQTIYLLIHCGEVKATRLRGKILVDADSFDAYLKRAGLALVSGPVRRQGREGTDAEKKRLFNPPES